MALTLEVIYTGIYNSCIALALHWHYQRHLHYAANEVKCISRHYLFYIPISR